MLLSACGQHNHWPAGWGAGAGSRRVLLWLLLLALLLTARRALWLRPRGVCLQLIAGAHSLPSDIA